MEMTETQFYSIEGVLVHSDCYNKNIIKWVAHRQYTFISHIYGAWEIQDQGAGRFNIW